MPKVAHRTQSEYPEDPEGAFAKTLIYIYAFQYIYIYIFSIFLEKHLQGLQGIQRAVWDSKN